MQLILISPSDLIPDETRLVSEMLHLGLARFHVRKPGWSRAAMVAYLAGIPTCYHSSLVLHSHYSLVPELGLGGIHLTAAGRGAGANLPLGAGRTLSTSFHMLTEVRQHRQRYDYVFLSPVFDSLSKEHYAAAFSLPEVAAVLKQLHRRVGYVPQVVALGGVEGHRITAVRQAGFAGAAVLGAVWQSSDPVSAFRALQSIIG